MPPRRVIAYALHEHELGAVHQALKSGLGTESFVIGDADEAVIADLRSHGIIVQELGPAPPPLASGSGARTFAPGETRRPRTGAPPAPSRIYRLVLKGPLLDEWRQEIERAGCEILEALPNFALRVRVDPARVLARLAYRHPVLDAEAVAAQQLHRHVDGANRTHFCSAGWGHGFHEDGVRSALAVCRGFGTGL